MQHIDAVRLLNALRKPHAHFLQVSLTGLVLLNNLGK